MLQRVQPEVGHVGRFGMAEDAEDAALVLELVEHVLQRHLRLSQITCSIAVDHAALGLVHATRRSTVSPPTAIRSRLPPVSPMTRAGTPRGGRALQHFASHPRASRRRPRATPTRRTAPPLVDAAVAGDGRAPSIDTSAPMPPVSKQHSASVTASPPSEQSCADRISRSSASVDEQRPAARARPRDRVPAARRAPGRARRFRYSLPPSSPRPSPSSTIDVAGCLEASRRRRDRRARAGRRRR